MKNITAVQVFAVMAILVGLVVSYVPPVANGAAIWGLVGTFMGFCMKELFTQGNSPKVTAPTPPEV